MPGTICWIDTETESEADLRTVGTAAYAEHPSTGIQLFSYAFGDNPVKLWSKKDGEPMPADLKAAFKNPDVIFWAHNVWFDRNIIENVLGIYLPVSRYRCSMAQALSHGLPAGLDKLGEVLGIREDSRKIKDGKRLVLLFCKPKKQRDGSLKWATPQTHPEDWARYKEYCKVDTSAMREIVKKIPRYNYPYHKNELEYWYVDQNRNSYGLNIDVELAKAAMEAISSTQKDLAKSTYTMTGGAVDTAGQRDAMLAFILKRYGFNLPDMQKATLNRLLDADDTPDPLRELLQVRLSACTTSTAKYRRIVQATSIDGRLRGTIQFSGAGRTQRDAGRVTQIQNYPSKNLLPSTEVKAGIEALKGGYADLVGYDIMHLSTSALRYTICAPEGKKLIVADLSNIEGRIIAWLAKEDWKLQAFRDFDTITGYDTKGAPIRKGHDLYKLAVAKAFGIRPEDVTKAQRDYIGKVLELALAYQGGCGAIVTFATAFGLDIAALADQVRPSIPEEVMREAEGFFDWLDGKDVESAKNRAKKAGTPERWQEFYEPDRTLRLPRETHTVLEGLKRLWRREHPKTQAFWKAVDTACRDAVNLANQNFHFGNGCYVRRSGKWVRIVLPSGHSLCYPGMRVDDNNSLVFKGVDQYTRRWGDIKTSPGKLAENCTQALARDVFKGMELEAERRGYKVVMPLHDELVVEVEKGDKFTLDGLCDIMSTVPSWATGLPLASAGFEDSHYHK